MCNIADTAFLGTFQGKQWQKDYLTGKANVSDTKKNDGLYGLYSEMERPGYVYCQ